VFIGHHRYENAPLDQIVLALLASPALAGTGRAPVPAVAPSQARFASTPDDAPVTMAHVIDAINEFVEQHPDMPLVSDTGDCLFATVEIRANECVAPAYYATMGFAVPAALGVQVSGGRRPLVLVGDGAFQMTGPEMAHAPAYGCNPVIVLLNNQRWEMLQAFFPEAKYNEVTPWPYAKLADLWGGRGFVVRTATALRDALAAAWLDERTTLIQVELAKGDISPVLRGFVDAFKSQTFSALPVG
jgi:indolepyruvate decarboxylase